MQFPRFKSRLCALNFIWIIKKGARIMNKYMDTKKKNKISEFFSRFIEKIDKKMQEKLKNGSCCNSKKNGDNSCCS